MKNWLIILVLSIVAFHPLYAQEWLTDFGTAQRIANEEDRNILIVFQGSDWCAPCIRMEAELWYTDTFLEFAEDAFVLVKADFPRRRKNRLSEAQTAHNQALADRYNQQGFFPYIVVLRPDGRVITEHSYEKRTPEEYIRFISNRISLMRIKS